MTAFGALGVSIASLTVTLAVLLWRFGALAGALRATSEQLGRDVATLQRRTEALECLPVVQRDLEQVKHTVSRMASEFPRIDKRLYRAEMELGIVPSAMHRVPRDGDDR